jgi:hypothetical protein
MLTIKMILIALSLSSGPGIATNAVMSLNTTIQAANGDYIVHYVAGKGTIRAHARNAAHFAADEGNNGVMPLVIGKRL